MDTRWVRFDVLHGAIRELSANGRPIVLLQPESALRWLVQRNSDIDGVSIAVFFVALTQSPYWYDRGSGRVFNSLMGRVLKTSTWPISVFDYRPILKRVYMGLLRQLSQSTRLPVTWVNFIETAILTRFTAKPNVNPPSCATSLRPATPMDKNQ